MIIHYPYMTVQHLGELFRDQIRSRADEVVSQLCIELRTAGNFQMQQGTEKDPWYNSTSTFVRSQFDGKADTKLEMEVRRVSRIHVCYPKPTEPKHSKRRNN